MSTQSVIIAEQLRFAFKGRRARIGVAFQGHPEVLEALLMEPHYFTVFGERFHPMFRVMNRAGMENGRLKENLLFLESRFDALPIRSQSLDALVLLGGLPRCAASPAESLVHLRELLVPGGMLIWPQPTAEGFLGHVGAFRGQKRAGGLGAVMRPRLTHLTMSAGFRDIGQMSVSNSAFPWTVTVARAAPRPWAQ